MARSEKRITWQGLLAFWVKVLALCIALGVGAFYVGRNYLGDMLSETDIREGAPRISAQAPGDSGDAHVVETAGPAKPEIRIEQREASELEAKRAVEDVGGQPREDADDAAPADDDGDADQQPAADTDDESDDDAAGADQDETAPADEQAADEASDDADGTQYIVTAGSFANAENSQKLLEELEAKGYQPYISKATIGDQTYRRVNVGAFSSRRDAIKLSEQLRNSGYEASVREK